MTALTPYEDRDIICRICGKPFKFTAAGQKFFVEKGFVDPTKCKPCRNKLEAQKQSSRH